MSLDFYKWSQRQDKGISDISCNFLQLIAVSLPLPLCATPAPPFTPPPPLSPVRLLVCVLVLAAAAVSPEVKQSAVIYQCVIRPIWEPRKPGPGLWRRSPELIKFQSSAMMNVKKLHPRYRRCGLGKVEWWGGVCGGRGGWWQQWWERGVVEEKGLFGISHRSEDQTPEFFLSSTHAPTPFFP